ncbi:MAG TPA: hypothetical protein VGB76_15620 [Pyrinomonadaceae bacterium]
MQLARDQAALSNAHRRNVSVEFDPPGEPFILPLDAAQVEDAVLNLVINVVEAVEA